MAPTKKVEDVYQKKDQREHALLRPGMYIGDIEEYDDKTFLWNDDEGGEKKMKERSITFNPGLYKLFDEILVNALDQWQREGSQGVKNIKVDITNDTCSVFNDCTEGIPVVIHSEHKLYIPDMIFGYLLSGSNYGDEKKTVGGTNGLGAKLCNIFSREFTIEVADGKKKFIKTWTGNMSSSGQHKISACKKSYTKITWTPDFERFGATEFTQDMKDVFFRRCLDIAAIIGSTKTHVSFCGKKVPVKNWNQYVESFVPDSYQKVEIFENDRWKITIARGGEFRHWSWVNGIYTSKGGTHVDHLVDQITKKFKQQIEKKDPDLTIRPSYIKDNIWIWVNCLIDNPTWDSQTKDNHVTRVNKWGGKYEFTDKDLKKIEKLGILENVLQIAKAKDTKKLSKTDGKKKNRLTGIPKLDDANKAGTCESARCKLILTEGDSAKSTAIQGLSVIGRDYYGVFPLRGKLLNTRDATTKQIMDNKEINDIKAILGLASGKTYKSTKDLRYGGIMIYTDQDNDGTHIKGLLINFIHSMWPSLLDLPGFVCDIFSPLVKATHGKTQHQFYSQQEYEQWKEGETNLSKWKIKYYKGLGTQTQNEAKEHFKTLKEHTHIYSYEQKMTKTIEKAFKKDQSNLRKDWIQENSILLKTPKGEYAKGGKLAIDTFIDNELILFSLADCERSLPHLIDGLKPSQRKCLWGMKKKNIKGEIKVAQVSGYISEQSCYHHGEQSLQETIINMAQDFPGSNNIPLFEGIGQFGTRRMGGKDASSPRYIFTRLSSGLDNIFDPLDDALLTYKEDDGQQVEPEFYVPTIPMILVNGSQGIGTGYSTSIPCYNPNDLKKVIRDLIADDEAHIPELTPWYKGWNGTITKVKDGSWMTRGVWRREGDRIIVTELPVGVWTQTYKEFLDQRMQKDELHGFDENHKDEKVEFILHFKRGWLGNLKTGDLGWEKEWKMTSLISTTNMHVWNEDGKIVKMSCVEEIIYNFFRCRLKYYKMRKNHLLEDWRDRMVWLDSKKKFVSLVVNDKIQVFRKPKKFIEQSIDNNNLPRHPTKGWDYLTKIPLDHFTIEEIEKLERQYNDLNDKITELDGTSPQQLWLNQL